MIVGKPNTSRAGNFSSSAASIVNMHCSPPCDSSMPPAVCFKELLHWQTLRKSIQEVGRANLAAPLDCPFCTPGLSTFVNAFLLMDLFRPRFIFVCHWFYIYCHCDCTDAGQCLSWAKMLKYLPFILVHFCTLPLSDLWLTRQDNQNKYPMVNTKII